MRYCHAHSADEQLRTRENNLSSKERNFIKIQRPRPNFQIGPQGEVAFQTSSVLRMLVRWGKRVLKATSTQQGTTATQQSGRRCQCSTGVQGATPELLRSSASWKGGFHLHD